MKIARCCVLLMVLVLAAPAQAGTACDKREITAGELARAAAAATHVRRELDAHDAPAALIARVGTDLSKYGLHYSHVGIALRDHPDGRWTVVHLLNECGTANSGIYAQGLVNFFADDLMSYEAKIVWLKPELAQSLADALARDGGKALYEPRYNIIARYDSRNYQNSTAWVLERLIAASQPNSHVTRELAHQIEKTRGFEPDVIDIPYSQRVMGGLFSANTVFTDHPLSARLSGHYAVVTVRAIFRFAHQQDWVEAQRVIDENGDVVLYQGD